jgi:hypothetical protein
MLRVLLALALVAAVSASGCPNKCSGHGSCTFGDKCECQPLFVGNDCSGRQCAYGLSWISSADTDAAPAGTLASGGEGLGGRHLYAECSDKGKCDRSTGECQCYEGYEGKGCRRQKCPNDCSGHGRCVYNTAINPNYSPQGFAANQAGADIVPNHFIEFTSQYWDKAKTRSCVCDRGFEGLDCGDRMCPKGDDPLTDCDGAAHGNDVQIIDFSAGGYFEAKASTVAKPAGFFTFTFSDMYGANYTTRPIELPFQDFALAGGEELAQLYADDMEEALESLPNFAIPNVTVTARCPSPSVCADGDAMAIKVEFVDPANSGPQNLLMCSYASQAGTTSTYNNKNVANPYNYGAAQPRFVSPVIPGDEFVCTAAHETTSTTPKEHVACSNRGNCDASTGLCECYDGFTGEACSTQTVFF